jgi:DNA topoisomerase-1
MPATKLLIVESPAKCKKIQEFLGSDWRVQATMGHIRALKEELEAIGFPKGGHGVPTWDPTYEPIATKRDAIAALRRAASGMDVYLGADDDREGEAIAWHTCAILGLNPATTPRVTFHEITASALRAAVASPGRIDTNKFNAQQARSMLDLLIGFTLSPCLWRGVGFKAGLSAGRCQTPALRIIYDRDREIEGHAATNSWRISATSATSPSGGSYGLSSSAGKSEDAIEGSTLEWRATGSDLPNQTAAFDLIKQLSAAPHTLTITDRTERTSTSQPPKPFITSSLQQEASSRMSMNPKITMRTAQTLYEGGHITYMRTDNAILSQEAIDAASAVVRERWGEEYLDGATPAATAEEAPKKVVKKKVTKKAAAAVAAEKPEAPTSQNAHEGIRPTHMEVAALDGVSAQEARLYELIWKRTIQSVMAPETRDVVKLTAVSTVAPKALTLQTDWSQTKFAGWRMLDAERKAEEEATAAEVFEARADLTADTVLDWQNFVASEVRSSPLPRYTEAALIRELESRSIGRPSTYATLVETVLDRGYVEKATIAATPVTLGLVTLEAGKKAPILPAGRASKAPPAPLPVPKLSTRTEKAGGEKDKLRATALGRTVIEWLLTQFGDMLDYSFTAEMEAQLDEIAKGTRVWNSVLGDTWDRYRDRYLSVMDGPKASSPATAGAGATPTALTSLTASSKRAEYGDGYKMVISKKGPLFVLEREGEKTRFASVPNNLSITTATRADAEAAFGSGATAGAGSGGIAGSDDLGTLDDKPVQRRKGPYGHYVQWGTVRLTCRIDETLEELTPRLQAKVSGDAVDHQVGEYKIKRGPYGLYMFKLSGASTASATRKPVFVSIPDTTEWATLTPEGAAELYKHSAAAKKEAMAAKGDKGASFKKEPKAAATGGAGTGETPAKKPRVTASRKKKTDT